jgi:glycosyltransferase involved in cell wall biosynthesis
MRVMQLTAHFRPNLGGVETHLDDLVNALTKRKWEVVVLSYQPLTTKTDWKVHENSESLEVFRIPWLPGLFYKLVDKPILEFLYLVPGLFLTTPVVIFLRNPDVIHAHGLVAAFVAVFWGNIFRKRVIISTHSIYHFPEKGLYRGFVKTVFSGADIVMGLSKKAAEEIKALGTSSKKVRVFTYWIDLDKFRPISGAKKRLHWGNDFVVLFVARLVQEKGVRELLEGAKIWNKNIHLYIAGFGPLESEIKSIQKAFKNIHYLGKINPNELSLYMNGADLVIVPSTHEEGFGRVILESLACGTPVIGSNRGAIPEAMDNTVGKLIAINPQNIKKNVEELFNNKSLYTKKASSTRKFAERRYSEKNAEQIINAYKGA